MSSVENEGMGQVGRPIARVGWPHEARGSLAPGSHVIRVGFAHCVQTSSPVMVVIVE